MNKEKLRSLWKSKSFRWAAVCLGFGLFLVSIGTAMNNDRASSDSASETQAYYSVRFYTESLEERIETLCCQVAGVKEAHVLLTLEGGSEYVYAENISGATKELFSLDKEGDERADQG